MIRFLLLSTVLLVCIGPELQGQTPELSGEWEGVLTQPSEGNRPLANTYAYSFSLTQAGDSLTGYTRIEIPDTPYFGVIQVVGKVIGNRVEFSETIIWDEVLPDGAMWCIKRGKLTYSRRKDQLRGVWESTSTCGPGTIVVYRKPNI